MKGFEKVENQEYNYKSFFDLEQGDVVRTHLGHGHNEKDRGKRGYRPIVIISNRHAHKLFGLAVAVPITSSNFRPRATVEIKSLDDIQGFAEPYQVISLDLRARGYRYAGKVSDKELGEILGKLDVIIRDE